MKLPALLLTFLLLALPLSATDVPSATLSLGAGKRCVEPAEGGRGSCEYMTYPAHLTNTSAQPLGYVCFLTPDAPVYKTMTLRPPSTEWKRGTTGYCSMGLDRFRLDPGASVDFVVTVFPPLNGTQFRVEMSLYFRPTPNAKPEQFSISSPVTLIQ